MGDLAVCCFFVEEFGEVCGGGNSVPPRNERLSNANCGLKRRGTMTNQILRTMVSRVVASSAVATASAIGTCGYGLAAHFIFFFRGICAQSLYFCPRRVCFLGLLLLLRSRFLEP